MIKVGDGLPAVTLTRVTTEGSEPVPAAELFAGKRVVLFAVPGAFTPTCSKAHLPGYVVQADAFFDKGIDMIACLSVNDAAVMAAWQRDQNADRITMLADGGAAFTQAIGMAQDTGDFGGVRSKRYAMLVEDGIVRALNLEAPKEFKVSDAQTLLALV